MTPQHIHETGELFEQVQKNHVFPDGKTFPDCLPKTDLKAIVDYYNLEKNNKDFDLGKFVHKYFDEPGTASCQYESDTSQSASEHIHSLWDVLTRKPENADGSLIPLPYPYIVPGGRFREIYYWDSYFTMLGLQVSHRADLIQNMVDNFSYLLDRVGHIPNGNRSYYIGRSQPPFYSLMVKLLSEEKGPEVLTAHLPHLEKEYHFWMNGAKELTQKQNHLHHVVLLPDGEILNRYWDENNTPRPEAFKEDIELAASSKEKPEITYRHLRAAAASGWDFSSRWFADSKSFATIHTTDIIPVDLNCLLYHHEEILASANDLAGNKEKYNFYKTASDRRKAAIQKYCWDEELGFYFDYDFITKKHTGHFTLAAAFPLFFRIATAEQAKKVAQILDTRFLQPGGLTTTLEQTGQQWDAPNGWAPLQWIAYKGLTNYKLNDLASRVKLNWLNANLRVYAKTGKMTEKYNVFSKDLEAGGGEYPNQDGFGWTNGVFLALMQSKD